MSTQHSQSQVLRSAGDQFAHFPKVPSRALVGSEPPSSSDSNEIAVVYDPRLGNLRGYCKSALLLILWDWRGLLPGWTLEFRCDEIDVQGEAFAYERRIRVYVTQVMGILDIAMIIAHEFGHALDVTYLDNDDRNAWLMMRGLPGRHIWWAGKGETDYHVGSGDWAESVAKVTVPQIDGYATIGGSLSTQQFRFLRRLLHEKLILRHPAIPTPAL